MRVQTTTICTLAAIASQGVTEASMAITPPPFSLQEGEANNFIVEPVQTATPAPIISLTPENLAVPEFAASFSQQSTKNPILAENEDPQQYIVNSAEQLREPQQTGPQIAVLATPTPDPQYFIVEPQTTQPTNLDNNNKSLALQRDNSSAETSQIIPKTEALAIPTPAFPSLIVEPQAKEPKNADNNNNSLPFLRDNPTPENPVISFPFSPSTMQAANQDINIADQLQQPSFVISQETLTQIPPLYSPQEVENIQNHLKTIQEKTPDFSDIYRGSPALTISNPAGYGADKNTGYIGATFQSRTRYSSGPSDGGLVVGVGLGDASKSVGVELSYTLASFGTSRDFGTGGFNAKLHRQIDPDFSVALGWNGLLNLGGFNEFENSIYGSATKVFRLQNDIKSPFSRLALTAGLGLGRFRTEDDVTNDINNFNPFGSIALRVFDPVSLIAEWTGQDLGLGASIVPFKDIPLVITPALRDVAGAGDGARFVLGVGYSFHF